MDRCPNCDSRYCRTVCHADNPRYAYVVGVGYVPVAVAGEYYLMEYPVDWRASSVATRRLTLVRDYLSYSPEREEQRARVLRLVHTMPSEVA